MELVISLIVGTLVGAVVFQQLLSLSAGIRANTDSAGMGVDTRAALDTLSDHVRNAMPCTAVETNKNSVLLTATTTSFSYYTDNTCGKWVRYQYPAKDKLITIANTLGRASDDASNDVVVVKNITSFSLTYYKSDLYNSAWTEISGAPAVADRPKVCGIRIDVTVTWNGKATRMSTLVRLRNSPVKVGLDGVS
ncbi:hypothetical protein EON81_21140 [bacterium]|nr:MAG: hypothetical protein EON81_21140 [bacterium]